jgi:nicotinate phosphoribosyltransferase
VRDVSVPPLGMKELDMGVTPRLVFFLRKAIDEAWRRWTLAPEWVARAQAWCGDIKIVVTGGFSPRKIRRFEELGVPADIYGVGSSLFSNSDEEGTNNDFTADIVRVKIDGAWRDLVKVGRRACDNPDLERIQ